MHYPNELYHHGVPNQRWGVRNGPPYPLNRSKKSPTNNKDLKSIKEVIKTLRNNDYADFSIKQIKYSALKYVDEKPVAFAYCRQYKFDGGTGVVLSVATNPDYRRRGYSKELAEEILDKCKADSSIDEICWAADITNEGSVGLAKSIGFIHWYDYEDTTVYIYDKK